MEFDKVSFEQWAKDISVKEVDVHTLQRWYHDIKLPKQGTKYAMGCDFFMPYPATLLPHNKIKIATGIRWVCTYEHERNYGLIIAPRSGLGTKYGMRLLNTIGIVDCDYSESDNEGEIFLMFENPSDEPIELKQGMAIAQGIVVPYQIPIGAETDAQRNGGLGSTDKTEGHV